MITQKNTYYEDYTIKTFSEFSGDVLVHYEEYNSKGNCVYKNIVGEYEKTYEYDTKGRIKRSRMIDNAKNISWRTYSYTKESMTILDRCGGNPPQIHKMVFGPDENGELVMISEKFL
jgi:hypothetical protein